MHRPDRCFLVPLIPNYGRVLPFDFIFELVMPFEFVFMFELDIPELMFVLLGVIIGVGIGVDIVMFPFELVRFVLTVTLVVPPSPHPAPKAPIANTAVSAIFFMILL